MSLWKIAHVLLVWIVCLWGLLIGFGGRLLFNKLFFFERKHNHLKYSNIQWKHKTFTSGLLSVVIPTINEGECIKDTLRTVKQLSAGHPIEVIVVDGGSTDDTLKLAQNAGVIVLQTDCSRALQQNAGAAIARGEYILFLHADTKLPPHYASMISVALSNDTSLKTTTTVAGAFQLQIDSTDPALVPVCATANFRSRRYHLPYGDQGLFVRSSVFRDIGGFPDQIFMEDYELVRVLSTLGDITILPAAVYTSPRRWEMNGVVWNTICNQIFVILYVYLGFNADTIHKLYYHAYGWFHQKTFKSHS